MRLRNRCTAYTAGVACTLAAALAAAPAEYPSQPLRVLVTAPAGTGLDLDARAITQRMSHLLRQPVVVDNRPAAAGVPAMEQLSKAQADGYTLAITGASTLAAQQYLHGKLPYDPERDFVPVCLMQMLPIALGVSASLGVDSVRELIARARLRPAEITFASQGNGSFVHLAGELFKSVAQIDLKHVPYGAQSPFPDLAGGHVNAMFTGIAPLFSSVKTGKVKILAISSPQRLAVMPEVPTFAEAGVPAYEASAWNGLIAPRGTPAAVLARLNAVAVEAVNHPEVKERMLKFGGVPAGSTQEEFAAFIQSERAKWGKLIRGSGLRAE
jgi:tripartite-type tricarboxylate transporter receptor subunit TctC